MKPETLSLLSDCSSTLERYVLEYRKNPCPPVEMVFNGELKSLDIPNRAPQIILVGDNPGKVERDEEKYLVGPAGNKAKNWFIDNMGLVLHRDVLVINKTPIFTPITDKLRGIPTDLLQKSEIEMADLAWKLTTALPDAALWIVGLGHYRGRGIFATFCQRLRENAGQDFSRIFLYPHFSRGHFHRRVPLDPCERMRYGQMKRLKHMGF